MEPSIAKGEGLSEDEGFSSIISWGNQDKGGSTFKQ